MPVVGARGDDEDGKWEQVHEGVDAALDGVAIRAVGPAPDAPLIREHAQFEPALVEIAQPVDRARVEPHPVAGAVGVAARGAAPDERPVPVKRRYIRGRRATAGPADHQRAVAVR